MAQLGTREPLRQPLPARQLAALVSPDFRGGGGRPTTQDGVRVVTRPPSHRTDAGLARGGHSPPALLGAGGRALRLNAGRELLLVGEVLPVVGVVDLLELP